MKKRLILSIAALCLLGFPVVATADEKPEITLANAHGLKHWDNVDVIEFTFFVDREPAVERSWRWDVKDQKVTLTVAGESSVLNLESIESEEAKKVHQQFINDSFWLLFPFNVVWSNPKVTDGGTTEQGLDGKMVQVRKLTALWPADEGYTPGDAYDLFIGEDQKILCWIFRKGNSPQGKLFIWENEMQAGPIRFTEHYLPAGADKPMISMRDVQVKMVGNDEWMLPVPRP